MTNKCEVCVYLKQYRNEDVSYLNNLIFEGSLYKTIKKECHITPIPNEKYFEQHKKECLKDFTPEVLIVNRDNNTLDHDLDNIQNPFSFKDHGDKDGETRILNLKKEWLSISEKLTQIVSYNVNKYNPEKITSSENIKETVANLKTITDLARADFTLEFLRDEENIYEYLGEEDIKTLNTLTETAQKKEQESKGK